MDFADQGGVPPARIGDEERVTPLELFFDLVFVFALTQVTGFLSHHLAWVGMLQGAALLMVAHDALRGRVKPLSDVSLGTERTRGGENDGDQRARYRSHPLDPLTAEEISSAVEILRKERDLGEKVRFAGIVVNEPPKEQVLSFNPGDYFEREALVVLVDGEEEAAYEAVVSLGEGMVESWERIEGDVQPPIVLEEFEECEEAYKLVPKTNVLPFAQEDAQVSKRGGFASKHFWVTPYESSERHAGGAYPSRS